MHVFVYGSWRYSYAPALNIASSSITIIEGDELRFSQKDDCKISEAKLYWKNGKWEENDIAPEPTDELNEGTHYYLCYYSSSHRLIFPLAQIYIAHIVDKISPVELSSFRTAGINENWSFEGGDQAFGDSILFGSDCNKPVSTDLKITRNSKGLYNTVKIVDFPFQQSIYFCYKSVNSGPTEVSYETIRFLEYKIVESPKISTLNQFTMIMNYDTKPIIFDGPLNDNDLITLSWEGDPLADCNPINFLNEKGYHFQQGYLPYIWYGKDSGIHGMNLTSDELHICWKSSARGAPENWIRLKSSFDAPFVMKILQVDSSVMAALPELESFDPPYGSTLATENTTEFKFNFHDEEIFPAHHAIYGEGILRIYRGAVRDDGTIDKAIGAPVLWESTTLNDTAVNDKFKQGDVECSLSGECLIYLSGDSKLKPGEIYYLSFYGYSFRNENGDYLFGNSAPVGTPMYDHMFQCRSFNIYNSDQTINGNFFKMAGENLLSITADAKINGNDIIAATFKTIALKVSLRIVNSTSCSSSLIVSGVIKLKDITETSFEINNLDLKG